MAETRTFKDQMGNEIALRYPPKRIISIVPSQTELLFDLELDQEVIGITKFCEHPTSWQKTKTQVGGTKKLRHEAIDALKPDLIIGNKEENSKADIETLRQKYPVWMSDIVTLEDALLMISEVAALTQREENGNTISSQVKEAFTYLEPRSGSVLYMIWKNPWMAAGSDTFIGEMLTSMGLSNVITTPRYPELYLEEIKRLNPEHVFLSSEPFPFEKKHIDAIKNLLPSSKITLVDGKYFSWYGSRLIHAPNYFSGLDL